MEDVIELRAPVFTEPPNSALVADIYQTSGGGAYMIEIPLPGLTPAEIDLQADTYSVTVSSKPARTAPNGGRKYIVREQSLRPMMRTFNFPVEIAADKVKATLDYGMLRICVPKAAAERKVVRVDQTVEQAA